MVCIRPPSCLSSIMGIQSASGRAVTGHTIRQSALRSRREFLAACCSAAAAGLGGLPIPAAAQDAGGSPALSYLDERLALITGAGGNIVVLDSADGLVMVDTGSAAHAAAVRSLLSEHFPGRTVSNIFNTHWHPEHTGGNEEFGADAHAIIAHENTRLWMSTTFYVEWEDRRYFPRPESAVPNTTFFSHEPQPRELAVDGERIVYAQIPQAHTDGDIYVHLPERNVLVAGGAVARGHYPIIDYITGGWIGGLADATQTMIDLADARTRIVPDTGAAVSLAQLQAQLTMLQTVRERIEAIALEGRGIDDMIEARITAEFDANYGDPELFIRNAYHGMWWNRLRGIVA